MIAFWYFFWLLKPIIFDDIAQSRKLKTSELFQNRNYSKTTFVSKIGKLLFFKLKKSKLKLNLKNKI